MQALFIMESLLDKIAEEGEEGGIEEVKDPLTCCTPSNSLERSTVEIGQIFCRIGLPIVS